MQVFGESNQTRWRWRYAAAVFLFFLATGHSVSQASPSFKAPVTSFSNTTLGGSLFQTRPEPTIGNRYALLVGVEDYAEISTLNGPVRDMCALREALVSVASFRSENIVLLARPGACGASVSSHPTKSAFVESLKALMRKMGKGDLLLLAFSGHGVVAGRQSFLMLEDSALNDKNVPANAFPIGDLRSLLEADDAKAGHVVVLIDACRNTVAGYDQSIDGSLKNTFVEDFDFRTSKQKSVSVLFSATVSEKSYIRSYEPISYFTWAVIKGLLGEAADPTGRVTLGDLADYVKAEVPLLVQHDFLAGTRRGYQQHPSLSIYGNAGKELTMAQVQLPRYSFTYTVEVVLKPRTAAQKSLSHQHVDIISPRQTKSLDLMFPLNVIEARPALAPIKVKYSRGQVSPGTTIDYLVRMTLHFGKWHHAFILCPESPQLIDGGLEPQIATSVSSEGVLTVDATRLFSRWGHMLGDLLIEADENPPKAESKTYSACPRFVVSDSSFSRKPPKVKDRDNLFRNTHRTIVRLVDELENNYQRDRNYEMRASALRPRLLQIKEQLMKSTGQQERKLLDAFRPIATFTTKAQFKELVDAGRGSTYFVIFKQGQLYSSQEMNEYFDPADIIERFAAIELHSDNERDKLLWRAIRFVTSKNLSGGEAYFRETILDILVGENGITDFSSVSKERFSFDSWWKWYFEGRPRWNASTSRYNHTTPLK